MYNLQHLFTDPSANSLFQLAVACLLGGALGLDRSLKHKPVGLKTCLIIALSTCLLTIVSVKTAEFYSTMAGNIGSDPMRLSAQVISGIGFIGTGVIMHRTNDVVSGITTAAMIWTSAGIGIAVGAGFYIDATLITLVILLILRYSNGFVDLFHRGKKLMQVTARLELDNSANVEAVMACLQQHKCTVTSIDLKEEDPGKPVIVTVMGNLIAKRNELTIYDSLKKLECVHGVDVKYLISD